MLDIGQKLITLGKIIIWITIIGSILYLFIGCGIANASLKTIEIDEHGYEIVESARPSVRLAAFSNVFLTSFGLCLGGITSGLLICGFGDFVENIDKIRQTLEDRSEHYK
jgi:hypothetical protein